MKIESWNHFLSMVNHIPLEKTNFEVSMFHFRGQSNFEWDLSPSLLRIFDNDMANDKKNGYESQTLMIYHSRKYMDPLEKFKGESSASLKMITDMQHYRCPTRLLDWTGSPFIALYFACNSDLNSDGAFYFWDESFFLSSLEKLERNVNLISRSEITDFKGFDVVRTIQSTIGNDRIDRQQGYFSISNVFKPHDQILQEVAKEANSNSGLQKFIVSKSLKVEFLSRLQAMNINSLTVYSGMDGLGDYIKECLTIRKWQKN